MIFTKFDTKKTYEPLFIILNDKQKNINFATGYYFKRAVKSLYENANKTSYFIPEDLIGKNEEAVNSILKKLAKEKKPSQQEIGTLNNYEIGRKFIKENTCYQNEKDTLKHANVLYPYVNKYNINSDVRAFYDFVLYANAVFLGQPVSLSETKFSTITTLFESWVKLDLHESMLQKDEKTYLETLFDYCFDSE